MTAKKTRKTSAVTHPYGSRISRNHHLAMPYHHPIYRNQRFLLFYLSTFLPLHQLHII